MNDKIRTIIVEDELPIREEIVEFASSFKELHITGVGKNGDELENLLDHNSPELALLDIELPITDTMEILSERKNLPHIIFITAHAQYALQVFQVPTIDYLIKPLTQERFNQAVDRAIQRIKGSRKVNTKSQVHNPNIWIRDNNRIVPLPVSELVYMEVQNKTTIIYTRENKKYTVTQSLSSLLEKLNPEIYIQIHRKYAVNLSTISDMEPLFGGNYHVTLREFDSKLPVSRRFAKLLLKEIKK